MGGRPSSHVPAHEGDRVQNPSPSEDHAVTSLPVIVEQPSIASPGSDVSPGTTIPTVKTEAGEGHTPQSVGEGTSLEPVMESPPKSETKTKESSRSSSSSSESGRKKGDKDIRDGPA